MSFDPSLNRRDFLTLAATVSGALAMPSLAGGRPFAMDARTPAGASGTRNTRASRIFDRPEFRYGLGGVPIGNEFEVVTDEDAYRTLEATWKAGARYFDVSPWYGLGLAERRFGSFLHDQPRDSYLLSTKVGKLLKASPKNNAKELFEYGNSPNNVTFDYTAAGVRRSIEDSLQRLGVDRIDVVFVHDISSDNALLPTPWPEQFAIALKGAFPELSRMREEGIIRGWGIGVNTPEPILRVIKESDPDVCLLASQYSLIDHANALNTIFPVARQHGVEFVVGSSLNAGFISGSPRYNYGKRSWDISREHLAKRDRLRAVASQFGVDLRTAAMQFSAAPDVAAALIVGAHTEAQALANASSMKATVPPAFWAELKNQGLIEQNAPIPSAKA